MTRTPDPRWSRDERRNARIRELRDERETPIRRRRTFQPVVLGAWLAGVMVLVGVLIFIGFLSLAPSLMVWVEEHPGSVDNGLVRDFVEWYEPEALADEPAGDDGRRISVFVEPGTTDSEIGELLLSKGLIKSQLAFQYAVIQAERGGTLQAGAYDLSPSLRPSQIVAALRQEAGEEITITLIEGWRLEEIVGYLGTTRLTMNLAEFASLATNPSADLLGSYDFLAALPDDRSLEGYLYPDTYRVDANTTARELIGLLLSTFDVRLTTEMRDQIAAQLLLGGPMTIDEAVRVASIVEREAVLDAERALIAGVYINRLNTAGWRLDADPTIQ
ncbi:MAG TPA: endolytic transglycosylase MltG, partial [Candidatus Limnocylindria bacterium]